MCEVNILCIYCGCGVECSVEYICVVCTYCICYMWHVWGVCVYVHMYICIYHGSDTNLCLSVLVPRGPEARLAGAKD